MEKYRKDLLNSVVKQKYDDELFLAIAKQLIKKLELTEYVKNISLKEISSQKIIGAYNGISIEIDGNTREDFILFYYRYLFDTLFHELQHAKQHKLISKYDEYYYKLPDDHIYTLEEKNELARIHAIGMSYKIMDLKKKTYSLKHDLFPTEREANYYGFVESTDFLVEMLPEFKKSLTNPNMYGYKIMSLLLKGYKIKLLTGKLASPFEQISIKDIKPYVKQILFGDNDLSNYERMILGLPIDKDLFLRLYNEMINGSIPTDIKEYILKI